MTEGVGAAKSESTEQRLFYRSALTSARWRPGMLERLVPQDRAGRFSMEPLETYQRSGLSAALAEMYVQRAVCHPAHVFGGVYPIRSDSSALVLRTP
jgi:hypothetical protein